MNIIIIIVASIQEETFTVHKFVKAQIKKIHYVILHLQCKSQLNQFA